jgi:hypothetical protein
MEYTTKLNKNISQAGTKRFSRLASNGKEALSMLSDFLNCIRLGVLHWARLGDVQKVQLQEYYTTRLLNFLVVGNRYVRSLNYSLREKTPEEECY